MVLADSVAGESPPGTASVAGATVVLHRVAPDTAGEVDSLTVAADGAFTFALPGAPDPGGRGDVYFASVRFRDIVYFGPPLTTVVDLDSLYTIEVHDTVLAPPGGVELVSAVRYLVLDPLGPGVEGWQVTDLTEVRVPGNRTFVAPPDGRTWSRPLPEGAADIVIGAGDAGPDAIAAEEGRLVVRAPLPPGERQFVIRYRMPEAPFRIPLSDSVGQIELLVREPAPELDVEGLQRIEPVSMDAETTYRRYAGEAVTSGELVIAPGAGGGAGDGPRVDARWVAVALGFLLALAGLVAVLRPRGGRGAPVASGAGAPPPPRTGEGRQALLLRIARIDERLEGPEPVPPAERERLEAERTGLVEALREP